MVRGRRVESSVVNAVRRVLLYGMALTLLFGGIRLHDWLEESVQAAEASIFDRTNSLTGTFGQERLFDMLARSGSDRQEAFLVSKALDKSLRVRRINPKDTYEVVRSSSGEFLHLTLTHGLTRHVVTGSKGDFRATRREIPVIILHRHGGGLLKGNLWISMEARDVPAWVIVEFAEVFQWTVDFLTESRNGDRFAVTWTERRTPSGRALDYEIQAAIYEGVSTGKQVGILYSGEYYDEKGESLKRMFLRAPLNFRRIS